MPGFRDCPVCRGREHMVYVLLASCSQRDWIMLCMMCEREYCEDPEEVLVGFCSAECKNVYEHLYGVDEVATSSGEC